MKAHQHKSIAENTENESLFVRSEYKIIKIPLHEIEYIEALEDYVKIHLLNARPVLSLITLKSVLEKLPAEKFKRIHRSYIIPINKVKSVASKKVELTTSKQLPISDSYRNFVNEWLKQ
jgi:DNA-binding LytR/AlgR family response regulator